MKNSIIFLMFSLLVLLAACGAEEEEVLSYDEQKAIDIEKIQNYLSDSSLIAEPTESGLYYIIEEEGTGNYPTVDSIVKVKYRGRYLDGSQFDDGTTEDRLSNYVKGWREGIPYFNEGSKGMLFVPSCLAYGIYGFYNIPGNAVLIFDIQLLDVND